MKTVKYAQIAYETYCEKMFAALKAEGKIKQGFPFYAELTTREKQVWIDVASAVAEVAATDALEQYTRERT